MNVVVQPAIPSLALVPGESLVLKAPDVGYRIEQGEVELYAYLTQDGRPMSRRLFLFQLRAGDMVVPGFSSSAAMTIALVAAESASLLPISTAFLAQSALMPDGAPAVAAAMDRWLSGLGAVLAPLMGTMPSETVSVAAGTKFETAAGSTIVGRGSACGWVASKDADLSYPDGKALPMIDGLQGAPLPPGVWLSCGASATAYVLPTAAALQQAIWPEMLRSQHDDILARLEAKLQADQGAALELSFQRFERTELALDRTMGRFAGVLDHAPAWTGAAAAHEQWLGPFTLVCDVLGIDLTRLQREAIAKATSMEEATRSARLRQRQIALRGAW